MNVPTKKRNLLPAMLQERCPRCRSGKMFTHGAYNLVKFTDMPERCPVCDLRFEVEPGFYYGAMYVSYGFSVGFVLVISFIIYMLVPKAPLWLYPTSIMIVVIGLAPLSFRYSRVLMLYGFGGVKYEVGKYIGKEN